MIKMKNLKRIITATALTKIHDQVFPKFSYVSDQERWGKSDHRSSESERWENGGLIGDCDEYAQEVCDRSNAAGIPAELKKYNGDKR